MAISPPSRFKKILGRTLRIIIKIVIVFFFLVIVILFLLQTSWVQNFGRKKIQAYLQSTLHTRVEIGGLSVDFPKKIVLSNIYLEDLRKDTLLAGGKLALDVNLWKLLSHTIVLNEIDLDRFTIKVKRVLPDSTFNYDFVIRAFSGQPTAPMEKKDSSAAWQFKIGKIQLSHIAATYKDDVSGNDVYATLQDFHARVDAFDPAKLIFSIPEISLSGVKSSFRQYQPVLLLKRIVDTVVVRSETSNPVSLSLGVINFKNILFDYRNDVVATAASLNLGIFNAEMNTVDLQKFRLNAKRIDLKNTVASYSTGKLLPEKSAKQETPAIKPDSASWKLDVAVFDFDNNTLRYDDNSKKRLSQGVDFNHLNIDHAKILINGLDLAPSGYQAKINEISFHDQSGFLLKKLSAGISYDKKAINVQNLLIQTNNSRISSQSSIRYASLAELSKRPGESATSVAFDHSYIALNDVMLLFPALKPNLKGMLNMTVRINGKIDGRVKQLNIPDLEIGGLHNTNIRLAGSIHGLPDAKKALYTIQIREFRSTREDLQSIVPADKLPASLRIPERFTVAGSFKGTIDRFNTKLLARTSNGNISVNGFLNIPGKTYDLAADLDQLQAGYLLKQDSLLGKVSLHATGKGTGFDYKTMNAEWHAILKEVFFKGYGYRDLAADADLRNGSFAIHALGKDPNIRFSLDGKGVLSTTYPSVALNLQLDTLNLHALHLTQDTLGMKFNLVSDFPSADPDALQGNLKIFNIWVGTNAQRLGTDTITLVAERKDTLEDIRLHAEMADIEWKGRYKITELSQAIEQSINHYYHLAGFKPATVSPQDWEFNALLRPSPLVLTYMPTLKGTDTVRLTAGFNSTKNDLHVLLKAPVIKYGDQAIHQLSIQLGTADSALNYLLQVADAGKQGFRLNHSEIRGRLANNQLLNTIYIRDSKNKEQYYIGTRLSEIPSGWKMIFNADSLMLNYEPWSVSKDNYVQYDSSGLLVHDLKLSHQDESLTINTAGQSARDPLRIDFKDFKIKTLTSFATQDSLWMNGLVNGKAEITNLLVHPVFTTDLNIQNLAYKNDTVGNVVIRIDNKQANAFSAAITISGHDNNAKLEGMYYSGEKKMDITMDFGQLNLNILKPFADGNIRDIHGYLKGKMQATGSLSEPQLRGNIHFDSTYITPLLTGEKLRLSNDNIEFDEDGINFSQYAFIDSAGNKAILDGNIYSKDFKQFRFDLSVAADNFRLVNAPKSPNNPIYGRLNIDARIDMTGDLESPKVNADIRVNKQTDFTFTLPSDDPEVVNRQGVVVFVDKRHPTDTARLRNLLDSLSRNAKLKGVDVAATIETDSNALFTMIIDERNGDALSLRGRADLAGGIDRSGKTTLTGNYELDNGSYNLSLSVLKRKFIIQRGSNVTWTGDPRRANVDITATYLVNTAPIDLVEQQLTGRSQDEINRFKQKLPFRVNLKMTGELLQPVITFDITLPPEQLSLWPEVDNKLTQMRTDVSEVNKQVFALLLLNRFVSENPFVSASGGTDAETMAKQSASKILTDQINQLAASLIKGVELSVDLNSDKDYSSGQALSQTQLTVGVSKNLFNDRVRVSVGSNFQLEQTNPNQNSSDIMGDVNVDYRLSKDGRYMLRAYRRDQYQSVVEGQVVETGLSFILTFDYNAFYELFRKSKPEDHKVKQIKKQPAPDKKNPAK